MSTKILYWDDPSDRQKLTKSLQNSNISIGDSDTVIGLLGGVTQKSFDRLNTIKFRSEQPYLLVVESYMKLDCFVDAHFCGGLKDLVARCWPGPLTIIFSARKELPDFVKSADGKIAVRVPDHEGLLSILASFDGLFSTSANIAGQPVPCSIDEVEESILDSSEYIILDRGREGDRVCVPSTIIDCSGEMVKLVREGAYPVQKIEEILGYKLSGAS